VLPRPPPNVRASSQAMCNRLRDKYGFAVRAESLGDCVARRSAGGQPRDAAEDVSALFAPERVDESIPEPVRASCRPATSYPGSHHTAEVDRRFKSGPVGAVKSDMSDTGLQPVQIGNEQAVASDPTASA
jgi:hypothetical protein